MRWCLITIFLFAGYLLDDTLATYVGYRTTAFIAEYSCSDISFLGAGVQEFFFAQAHVWRSSLRIDGH